MLKDYVIKSDLQYIMSTKVSIEEVRGLLDSKANYNEIRSEMGFLQ
jgi:hypothetical protein